MIGRRDMLLGGAGLLASFAGAASARPEHDAYADARSFILKKLEDPAVPSVSVAVIRNGRIDWEESFGWADREAMIKATPDTPYSLASISKSFTGTGLMVLAGQNKLDLDKPINTYLGYTKLRSTLWPSDLVTVRQVANHTSGLPFFVQFYYYDQPYRRPSMDVTISRYGFLESKPGEEYFYSNLGYGILGEVNARVSGVPFAEFLRRSVFLPLGLTHTSLGPEAEARPPAAVRYTTDGTRLPYYDTDHPGASEIFSSAHDLIRFAAFHLKAHLPDQAPILSDAAVDEMHVAGRNTGEENGYGIGFEVSARDGVISHSGSMPGVATQMMLFPKAQTAIVVLCNSWSSDVVDEITHRIARAVVPDWKPGPPEAGWPQADAVFSPPHALVGKWRGTVATSAGAQPSELDVRSDGVVTLTVGKSIAALVDSVVFNGGQLIGEASATIRTPETERFRYTVRPKLKLDGDRLYGALVALGDLSDQRIAAGLSFWTDLQRSPS